MYIFSSSFVSFWLFSVLALWFGEVRIKSSLPLLYGEVLESAERRGRKRWADGRSGMQAKIKLKLFQRLMLCTVFTVLSFPVACAFNRIFLLLLFLIISEKEHTVANVAATFAFYIQFFFVPPALVLFVSVSECGVSVSILLSSMKARVLARNKV